MESQPSTSTTASTTAKQDIMTSSQNSSVYKMSNTSNADPTLSIPNPAYSPVFQQYVTDAAAIIASTHLTRNMFIVEVFKKCSEIALWEKKTGKTDPELLPESPVPTRELPHASDSYFSDVQHITPEGEEVLNRFIKKYSMPRISNPVSGSTSTVTVNSFTEFMSPNTSTSGTTNTVTVSSTLGEETPTSTTSNPPEGSTPHAEWRKTTRMATENYNTSGSMMKNKVEQCLPTQAKTLFVPIGMAEDLAKIQLILCKEIKTEIQAMKESITTIPFDDVQRKITEATTVMCGNISLTIRETETLTSKELYIQVEYICLVTIFPY